LALGDAGVALAEEIRMKTSGPYTIYTNSPEEQKAEQFNGKDGYWTLDVPLSSNQEYIAENYHHNFTGLSGYGLKYGYVVHNKNNHPVTIQILQQGKSFAEATEEGKPTQAIETELNFYKSGATSITVPANSAAFLIEQTVSPGYSQSMKIKFRAPSASNVSVREFIGRASTEPSDIYNTEKFYQWVENSSNQTTGLFPYSMVSAEVNARSVRDFYLGGIPKTRLYFDGPSKSYNEGLANPDEYRPGLSGMRLSSKILEGNYGMPYELKFNNATGYNISFTPHPTSPFQWFVLDTGSGWFKSEKILRGASYPIPIPANGVVKYLLPGGMNGSVKVSLLDVQKPSSTPVLSSQRINDSSVMLKWSSASDNSGYVDYAIIKDGTELAVTSKTSYKVEKLNQDRPYVFVIRAKDKAGNFVDSQPVPVTTKLEDTQPPSAPVLKESKITETTAEVKWTASKDDVGVKKYDIYVDGNYVVSTTTKLSYKFQSLVPNTTYRVTVRATDAAGRYAESNVLVIRTPGDRTKPDTPKVSASEKTDTSVILNWNKVKDNLGVVKYNIFNNDVYIGTTESNTTFKVTGLSPDTSYKFKVRAIDAAGNYADSRTVTVRTAKDQVRPDAPVLNATEIGSDYVKLQWSPSRDNIGIKQYNIYNGSKLVNSTSSATSYTVSGLKSKRTYTFKVRAVDMAGNYTDSSTITINTK